MKWMRVSRRVSSGAFSHCAARACARATAPPLVVTSAGPLEDSSFVSRRLASAPRYLVANPAYLERRGAPVSPADLQAHDLILGRAPGTDVWHLRHARGGETSIKLAARVVATSVEGVLAAAVAGLGIAAASLFACRAELERGELMRVLDRHTLSPIDVQAVFPTGRRPPAKARAFVDHLAAALAGTPADGDLRIAAM